MLFERICYELGALTVEVLYFSLIRSAVRRSGSWIIDVASRRRIDSNSAEAVTNNIYENLEYLNY